MTTSGGARLKKEITIVDVVAIGIGATVGVSIFAVMQPAAKLAGAGMLIALGIAAIPMVVFAVVYAFMASTVPRSGASYDWPTKFVHPYVGFMVAWLRIVGNVAALTNYSVVLVEYVSTAIPLPDIPTRFALLAVFFALNLIGVKVAARTERYLVALKILALGVFVVVGVAYVRPSNLHPMLSTGWVGIAAAVPVLISLYTGIESATEVGEEIKNSRSVIARGIGATVVLSVLIYFSVSTVSLGVLGAPGLASSQAPVLDAGKVFLGRWAVPLILVTAAAAITTATNAVFLTFTRFLFAMGRDGVLPPAFAKIHERWGTPYVATIAVFLCSLLGLLLPSNLIFLFLATSIPVVLKYMSNCLSATRLIDNYPALFERAQFKFRKPVMKRWGYAGIVCAVIILVAGWNADWRPYVMLLVWAIIGTAYWFARGRHSERGETQGEW
jgi:APA family basic amino acid/polyamine antiporter